MLRVVMLCPSHKNLDRLSWRVGRPPIGVERMLRMYFLQQWYSLSDEGLDDALYDSQAMLARAGQPGDREEAAVEACRGQCVLNAARDLVRRVKRAKARLAAASAARAHGFQASEDE
jgi:hypothetical protein